MLSLNENVEMLSSFGLTHNQAKVYIAIAKLRIASVSQVSKVRREDVYSTDQPLSHYMIVDYKEVLVATSIEPTIGKNPYLWLMTTTSSGYCKNILKAYGTLPWT